MWFAQLPLAAGQFHAPNSPELNVYTSPSVTEFSLRHSEVNNTFAIVLKEAGIKNCHKSQKSESRV